MSCGHTLLWGGESVTGGLKTDAERVLPHSHTSWHALGTEKKQISEGNPTSEAELSLRTWTELDQLVANYFIHLLF